VDEVKMAVFGSSPKIILAPHQIKQIERALDEVGEFGEVRLIKAKGKLRFIQRVISEEALTPAVPREETDARPDRRG
jgi:hypothetical protein